MATNNCIVHSRKNISNFNAAVNQLHRENKFSHNVYQELPKRCCSCKGKKGLKTIDLEILREMCEDIEMSIDSTLKFRFSSNMNRFLLVEDDDDDGSDDSTSTSSDANINTCVKSVVKIPYIPRPTFASRAIFSRWRNTKKDSTRLGTGEQNTSSNPENKINEFLKVLETFKVVTVAEGCIVHNSKYQSKFNQAVNLIRRGKTYTKQIYYELPKRCCSCNGKIDLNVIDLNILINICEEIVLEQSRKPKSSFDLRLSFEPETDFRERQTRIGRFIGNKGENFNVLQDKYNVLVNINQDSPSWRVLRKNIKKQKRNNSNELQMFVRRKDKSMIDKILIDKIKEEINEKWEEASEIRFIQKQFTFDQNQFQFISVSFESSLSSEERQDIMGRFIGKKGENLRHLEDQYNIRLHIINNQSSNRKYFQKIIEVQENNPDIVYLFLTRKDKSITNEIPIEEVKEQFIQKWKEATIEPTDDELFHILSFSYESKKSFRQYQRKIGCFIGKNGQHLRDLQNKYNVNIQIINLFSGKKLQKKLAKIQDIDKVNKLYLLVTNKNKSTTNTIPIDNIEQDLIELWTNGKQTTDVNKIKSSKLNPKPISLIEPSSYNRWHQKKIYRRK